MNLPTSIHTASEQDVGSHCLSTDAAHACKERKRGRANQGFAYWLTRYIYFKNNPGWLHPYTYTQPKTNRWLFLLPSIITQPSNKNAYNHLPTYYITPRAASSGPPTPLPPHRHPGGRQKHTPTPPTAAGDAAGTCASPGGPPHRAKGARARRTSRPVAAAPTRRCWLWLRVMVLGGGGGARGRGRRGGRGW